MLCLLWPWLAAADFDESKTGHIDYPAWFAEDAFLDIEEMLSEAQAQGRQGVMLLFTTEGCSYCEQFIRDLADPDTATRLQQSYLSLGLEIFDDAEIIAPDGDSLPVKQFAVERGVEFAPTLLFYSANGERMGRYTGYQSPERFKQILDYLNADAWKSSSLSEYLATISGEKAADVSRALPDDPLFEKPPYALDRSHISASRPLMVLFARKSCDECMEFHKAVLSVPEVRSTLKRFEVVQLDVDDRTTPVLTPDGKKLDPASWYAQTGLDRVPALLFFNETGQQALSTDALVMRGRMMNSLNFMLERAYEKDWTYQRFARSKGIERAQKAAAQSQ